ncbi:MAG: hypothetical protein ACJ73S_06850 [Mycobacteriales bacterium]
MGWLNRTITRCRVNPEAVETGGWAAGVARELPMLTPSELLTLATLRAALTVPAGRARAAWVAPGETRLSVFTEPSGTVQSVLRAESVPGGGGRISCGAPSPWGFCEEWAVLGRAAGDGTDGLASLQVPAYRTVDGALRNTRLLAAVREALADTLAGGPGPVALESGPPHLDRLVAVCEPPVEEPAFALADDYVLPVPPEFVHGATVPLPPDAGRHVLAALRHGGWPVTSSPSGAVAALDGGRTWHTGLARIGGRVLGFELPEEGEAGRQGTFRAAATLLAWLAHATARSAPATSAALTARLERWTAPYRDPERVRWFRPAWDAATPAAAVTLRPDTVLPVGLVVTTRQDGLPALLFQAQAWLPARERLAAEEGPRRRPAPDHRRYQRRGPASVRRDGRIQPCLRYAHTDPLAPGRLPAVDDRAASFWEVTVRDRHRDDGRHEAVVLVSGLSRMGGTLCYGAELMGLLDIFAWLVRCGDPGADVRTVTLRPGADTPWGS